MHFGPGEWPSGGTRLTRGRNLIVRVLKGRVNPDQVAAFRAQAQVVVQDLREHDGLVHTEVARQVSSDGGEEVILVSVWRDLAAIYGWLGVTNLLDSPMTNHGEPNLLDHFDVQHYEVLESAELGEATPDDMSWAAPERPLRAAGAYDA